MSLWERICGPLRPPNWDDGRFLLGWTGFNLVGSLLPLWGSTLLLLLLTRRPRISDVAGHAEFSLFAAALLSSALFLLLREGAAKFPFRVALGLASSALLLVATLTFAASFIAYAPPGGVRLPLDADLVFTISAWTYGLALLVALATTFFDSIRYDPGVIPREQLDTLAAEFHAEGGGGE